MADEPARRRAAVAIRTLRAAVKSAPANRVVPLSPKMVGLRFSAAARAAGVEHVTAHSGRVGLVSELTSRGASTTDVMLAGNWKTSRMVAHYSAGAEDLGTVGAPTAVGAEPPGRPTDHRGGARTDAGLWPP